MTDYKFKDKNHPPVPTLKVGDKCYAFCDFGRHYDYVSTCEVRKVDVKWYEPTEYEKKNGWCGYWHIDYYVRIVYDYLNKSTKRFAYRLGDDGRDPNLFLTPQEVLDINIRDFKKMVIENVKSLQKKMTALGYTQEQATKLLEFKQE